MHKLFQIDPQSAIPLYAQIIELVKESVLLEELTAGDALPSVRLLAKDLKVNSLTIQKAYKILSSEGIIQIKKGIGAFISDELKPIKKISKYQIIEEKLSPIIEQAKIMDLEEQKIVQYIEDQWRKK
jgi:GntR family transcriptional regulator